MNDPLKLLIDKFLEDLRDYDKFLSIASYGERRELKRIIERWESYRDAI